MITGVWSQPVSSFATWKARGVNTLVRWESQSNTVTVDAYCAAAQASGFQIVLQADGTATSHYADSNCIAVALPDEPNGAGNLTPAQCFAQSQAIRATTTKPIFLNLDGWHLQYRSDADVWSYCACADWIGIDYYVINRGEIAGIGAWSTKLYPQVQRIQRLAPNKPMIVFVETSNQQLSLQPWAQQPDSSGTPPAPRMRGPTVVEFLTEAKTSISWGCSIAYFPDVIGLSWEAFDGTPLDISGAMTALA